MTGRNQKIKVAAVYSILSMLFLLFPQVSNASVLGIRGYSNPSGGQDRFQFDVYVSSNDDYPTCDVVARYNDGTPDYKTRGVASFSMNIKPSKPSTIYITCESVTASTSFAGNSYPFAGDIMRVIGNPPASAVKNEPVLQAKPTLKPSPSPTATQTPTESLKPASDTTEQKQESSETLKFGTIVTSAPGQVANWVKVTFTDSFKKFFAYIGSFWKK